jgi:hypothetical protein
VLTDSYHTDSIPDESAATQDDDASGPAAVRAEGSGCGYGGAGSSEALAVVGPERAVQPDAPDRDRADEQMFLNWYEGNLSRCELTRLYCLPMDGVDETLVRVARTYDDGRHYGMVKWLVEMGEDGDIIWLLSKDMTAADVGQKIQRNQWVVYKHRDAILKRLAALGLTGAEGRAVFARMLGMETGMSPAERAPEAGRRRAAPAGLAALSAQAPPG